VLVDRVAHDLAVGSTDRASTSELAPHVFGLVVVPEVGEERDQLLADVTWGDFPLGALDPEGGGHLRSCVPHCGFLCLKFVWAILGLNQ
jgi:hypothetical protein